METNKIYLGDCLQVIKDNIDELKNLNICIITDPPFNVGYHYNEYKDNKEENEYIDWLCDIFSQLNCPFVVVHYPETIYKIAIKMNKSPTKVVSWVYNSNNAKQHRDIAFFGITPNFDLVKQPYKNLNDERIKERIAKGIEGGRLYDWWYINQIKNVSKKFIEHPCIMPLEVIKNIIGILPNDLIIMDPFTGSGTTCLGAKELGRQYIGIEINKDYYKTAVDRLNGINKIGQTDLFNTDFEQLDLFGEK